MLAMLTERSDQMANLNEDTTESGQSDTSIEYSTRSESGSNSDAVICAQAINIITPKKRYTRRETFQRSPSCKYRRQNNNHYDHNTTVDGREDQHQIIDNTPQAIPNLSEFGIGELNNQMPKNTLESCHGDGSSSDVSVGDSASTSETKGR